MRASAAATRAVREIIANAVNDPLLMTAGLALSEGRLAAAEPLLRARLRENSSDVVAIRMMAELRAGSPADLRERHWLLAAFHGAFGAFIRGPRP